jgi:hypothetical protein
MATLLGKIKNFNRSAKPITIMQPLNEKLSDIRMLVAISSIKFVRLGFSTDTVKSLDPKVVTSYHTKQIAALSIRSTCRLTSHSTTCIPPFSKASIC